jgi:hypothetical protein
LGNIEYLQALSYLSRDGDADDRRRANVTIRPLLIEAVEQWLDLQFAACWWAADAPFRRFEPLKRETSNAKARRYSLFEISESSDSHHITESTGTTATALSIARGRRGTALPIARVQIDAALPIARDYLPCRYR